MIVLLFVVSILIAFFCGGIWFARKPYELYRKAQAMSDKHLDLFLLMCKWFELKQNNKSITDYLKDNNYNNVAVYGVSYIGIALISELENSDVEVAYGIDTREIDIEIPVYKPENELPDTDIVIVTPVTYYEEIKGKISGRIDCPIVSLIDVLEMTSTFY